MPTTNTANRPTATHHNTDPEMLTMNDKNTATKDARLPDRAPVADLLRRFGDAVDLRRLAGGLRRLAEDLLPAQPTDVERELLSLLSDWAGTALPDGLLSGAPLPPTNGLSHALLSWRPAADAWELKLVGWCASAAANVGAVRRQAAWELPWDELPDAVRALVIRSGKKAGSRLLVEDPELRTQAPAGAEHAP